MKSNLYYWLILWQFCFLYRGYKTNKKHRWNLYVNDSQSKLHLICLMISKNIVKKNLPRTRTEPLCQFACLFFISSPYLLIICLRDRFTHRSFLRKTTFTLDYRKGKRVMVWLWKERFFFVFSLISYLRD